MAKILVVDDEQGVLDLLADNLSDDGHDVISATNGASALVLIYRERPDAVLLDLMIPLVNRYEVLRELRCNPTTKKLPVILLTAVSPAEGEKAAIHLGANHYLTKPWKTNTILQMVRDVLEEADSSGCSGSPPSDSRNRPAPSQSGSPCLAAWRFRLLNSS